MTLTFIPRILTPVLALALAGCSMGSMFGGGDPALSSVTPSQSQIDSAVAGAMPAIATECPEIKVRDGAGSYRVTSGNAVRYQAVIDRISRNCVVSNGQITVSMGAVGRVIPGPAFNQSSVNVPLRFVVVRDGMAVFSELYSIPVTVSANAANEFAYTAENVAVPYVGGEDITFWVGFDN
ncbi:hypothetical protein [Pelagibacterium halotolerans]|uniref:hypothetical protein n=1 Tax=Pelagibacterium halotolerans TaxID=531813 RepID=UPI00384ADBD3